MAAIQVHAATWLNSLGKSGNESSVESSAAVVDNACWCGNYQFWLNRYSLWSLIWFAWSLTVSFHFHLFIGNNHRRLFTRLWERASSRTHIKLQENGAKKNNCSELAWEKMRIRCDLCYTLVTCPLIISLIRGDWRRIGAHKQIDNNKRQMNMTTIEFGVIYGIIRWVIRWFHRLEQATEVFFSKISFWLGKMCKSSSVFSLFGRLGKPQSKLSQMTDLMIEACHLESLSFATMYNYLPAVCFEYFISRKWKIWASSLNGAGTATHHDSKRCFQYRSHYSDILRRDSNCL